MCCRGLCLDNLKVFLHSRITAWVITAFTCLLLVCSIFVGTSLTRSANETQDTFKTVSLKSMADVSETGAFELDTQFQDFVFFLQQKTYAHQDTLRTDINLIANLSDQKSNIFWSQAAYGIQYMNYASFLGYNKTRLHSTYHAYNKNPNDLRTFNASLNATIEKQFVMDRFVVAPWVNRKSSIVSSLYTCMFNRDLNGGLNIEIPGVGEPASVQNYNCWDDDWTLDAKANLYNAITTDVYYDSFIGANMLSMTFAVGSLYGASQATGVSGIDLTLNDLKTKLQKLQFTSASSAFLVSSRNGQNQVAVSSRNDESTLLTIDILNTLFSAHHSTESQTEDEQTEINSVSTGGTIETQSSIYTTTALTSLNGYFLVSKLPVSYLTARLEPVRIYNRNVGLVIGFTLLLFTLSIVFFVIWRSDRLAQCMIQAIEPIVHEFNGVIVHTVGQSVNEQGQTNRIAPAFDHNPDLKEFADIVETYQPVLNAINTSRETMHQSPLNPFYDANQYAVIRNQKRNGQIEPSAPPAYDEPQLGSAKPSVDMKEPPASKSSLPTQVVSKTKTKLQHILTHGILPYFATFGAIIVVACIVSIHIGQNLANTYTESLVIQSKFDTIKSRLPMFANTIDQIFSSAVFSINSTCNHANGNVGAYLATPTGLRSWSGIGLAPIPTDGQGIPLFVSHYKYDPTTVGNLALARTRDFSNETGIPQTSNLIHAFRSLLKSHQVYIKQIYAASADGLMAWLELSYQRADNYITSWFMDSSSPDGSKVMRQGYQPKYDSWFRDARPGIVNFTRPYYDADTKTLTVSVHSKIDSLGLVLALDLDLSSVQRKLEHLKMSDNGYSFLISKNGELISHPRLNLSITAIPLTTIEPTFTESILKAAQLNNPTVGSDTNAQQSTNEILLVTDNTYLACTNVNTPEYRLCTVVPRSDMFLSIVPLKNASNKRVTLAAIMLPIGFLALTYILWFIVSEHIKTLQDLTKHDIRVLQALGTPSIGKEIQMSATIEKILSDALPKEMVSMHNSVTVLDHSLRLNMTNLNSNTQQQVDKFLTTRTFFETLKKKFQTSASAAVTAPHEDGCDRAMAICDANIAITCTSGRAYENSENRDNALVYMKRSIDIVQALCTKHDNKNVKDRLTMANRITTLGSIYILRKEYNLAEYVLEWAQRIYTSHDCQVGNFKVFDVMLSMQLKRQPQNWERFDELLNRFAPLVGLVYQNNLWTFVNTVNNADPNDNSKESYASKCLVHIVSANLKRNENAAKSYDIVRDQARYILRRFERLDKRVVEFCQHLIKNESAHAPLRILFVIDVSYSMQPNAHSNKIGAVKTKLKNMLCSSLLRDDTEICIASFYQEFRVIFPWSLRGPIEGRTLQLMYHAINFVSLGGGTRLYGAMYDAYQMMNARDVATQMSPDSLKTVDRIFMLTDGNDCSPNCVRELDLLKSVQVSSGCQSVLVTVGNDIEPLSKQILTDVLTRKGGFFISAADGDQGIAQAFQTFSEMLDVSINLEAL